MEKKFRITVDGRLYNVTVEDLSDGGSQLYSPPASMLAAAQAAAPAAPVAAEPVAARGSAGPGDVVCTLGGVVESVVVTVGQSVNAGDKVAVIEAMKMKTPMTAHRAGRVASIAVKPGEAVETGQVLLTIS